MKEWQTDDFHPYHNNNKGFRAFREMCGLGFTATIGFRAFDYHVQDLEVTRASGLE